MAAKAYFMINVAEQFGYQEVLKDLIPIPEVESIERIDGMCDLLVKVGVPVAVDFVADEILLKKWVKSLRVLKVEPVGKGENNGDEGLFCDQCG